MIWQRLRHARSLDMHRRECRLIALHRQCEASVTRAWTDAVLRWRSTEELRDRPEFDATDAAHPAWWRGHDHAEKKFKEKLAKAEKTAEGLRQLDQEHLRLLREMKDRADGLEKQLRAEIRAQDKFGI